jgi:predicted nucleic acid-binding protein
MSWINLIEVHYRTIRDHGQQEADQVLAELRPLVTESLPGIAAMRSASSLKAEHPMALADCFAVALAAEEEAELLTGDPEIIDRTDQLPCRVVDLRRSR